MSTWCKWLFAFTVALISSHVANGQSIVFDISSLETSGSGQFSIVDSLEPGILVTEVTYDNIAFESFAPSWRSEVGLGVTNSSFSDGAWFYLPAVSDSPGAFSGSGSFVTESADLTRATGGPFMISEQGEVFVFAYETFDDADIDPDAVFSSGTVTVHYTNPRPRVDFEFATVGNPGNAADSRVQSDGTSGYGAVAESFRISKTEVTNAQYAAFLNSVDSDGANSRGLYNSKMETDIRGGIAFEPSNPSGSKYAPKSGQQNHPVVFVSYADATRFANWLHNDQSDGDTETGAYALSGDGAVPTNIETVARESGARFFVPSEDEWYKAAYHDAEAGTAEAYFDYANGSITPPVSDLPEDDPSGANYFNDDGIDNGFNDGYAVSGTTIRPTDITVLTDVDAYFEAESAYGTLGQVGNVSEITEGVQEGVGRVFRGGSFSRTPDRIGYAERVAGPNNFEVGSVGFRIATVIPEPGIGLLLVAGLIPIIRRRRPTR